MIKKLIAIIALLCCNIVSAQTPNLKIFFVNGISNSEIDAKKSASDLGRVLSSLTGNLPVESIYNPTGRSSGLSVNGLCLAFDPASQTLVSIPDLVGGIVGPGLPWTTRLVRSATDVCIISDFGELRDSKLNEENYFSSYNSSFVVGNNPQFFGNLNQTSASQFIAAYFSKEKLAVQAVAKLVARQVKNSIAAGNKVLLVAHSQGNVVVNWAWVLLASELSEANLKKLRILNVANTSLLSPHGANITHSRDDAIYGWLRRLGRLPLRRNSLCQPTVGNGTCDFLVADPTYSTTEAVNQSLTNTHNFVAAYLSDNSITNVVTGQRTSFANAMIATTRSLLESMGAIAPILPTPNIPPTASFVPNVYSGSMSTEFRFRSNLSGDPDGQIVNYAWNLGDGTTRSGAQLQEVIHSYGAVGQYTVTLTVTDNQGATGSDALQVSITATPQPDLVPSLVTVSPASVAPGGSVNVSWRITNSGNANAAASTTGIRLLPAATSGNGSAANTLVSVPTGVLASGSVANQTQAITIPANTAPGSYVVVVVADNVTNGTLGQNNTSNDFARSSALIVCAIPPCLQSSLGVPTGLSPQGVPILRPAPIMSQLELRWDYVSDELVYDYEVVWNGLSEPYRGNTLQNIVFFPVPQNGVFNWKVRACSRATGSCSNYANAVFEVQSLLDVPNGLVPGNGDQANAPLIVGSDVLFRWNPVSGSTYYEIRVYGDDFSSPDFLRVRTAAGNEASLSISGFFAGLYKWRLMACTAAGICTPSNVERFFRIQASTVSSTFRLFGFLQSDLYNLTGQAYGAPSGNAYTPRIDITGAGLDGVNRITWSWTGATNGSSVWTKSSAGIWTNELGAARSVSLVSSSQIAASPTLITTGDTWRGTLNWTVRACIGLSVCDSLNFIVQR